MALIQILTDGTETGLTVANKMNDTITEVDASTVKINTATSDISTVAADVVTVTADLSTATSNIVTITADVVTLTAEAAKINLTGDTASRPATPDVSQKYFDTDLSALVYWDGAIWQRQDFLTEVGVNELIREYSTIVEQVLGDQKKPTRDEALSAFKTLPHHDWTKNDTFYIRDDAGANKMVFCTYIADGATDEATAGPIFYKDMVNCV